jgi:uncharacterized protein with GYD domain
MVGVAGNGFTVTIVAVDVAEQDPLETVTVYEPLVVTAIDWVVAPVDQVFPVAEEDVNVIEPPAQKVVGPLEVMIGVAGNGFTVTIVAADVAEQDPLETVTVYEPLVETVIDWVVSAVDQVFPVAEEDVNVTEPPVQNVVEPLAVMVGVAGNGFTVTIVAAEVAEQDPLETVTVYEPPVVTAID